MTPSAESASATACSPTSASQVRNGRRTEPALITAGDDLPTVSRFLKNGGTNYSAHDVIRELLAGCEPAPAADLEIEVSLLPEACESLLH
jgi:hypothetical protein